MFVTLTSFTRPANNSLSSSQMQRGCEITTDLDSALAFIQNKFLSLPHRGRLQVSFEGAIGFNYFDADNDADDIALHQIVMNVELSDDQEAAEMAVEHLVGQLGAKASILQTH